MTTTDVWTIRAARIALGALALFIAFLLLRMGTDVVTPPSPEERCSDRGGMWLMPPSSNGMCLAPGLFR